MKTLFYLLTLIIISGCNSDPVLIKQDLNKRFTNYELLEVHPDSTNDVKDTQHLAFAVLITASKTYSDAIEAISNDNYDLVPPLMDKIHQGAEKLYTSASEKSTNCYYVKYSLPIDYRKIEFEEYYIISNKEVRHRPVNLDEYLKELKCDEILELNNKILTYLRDIAYQY